MLLEAVGLKLGPHQMEPWHALPLQGLSTSKDAMINEIDVTWHDLAVFGGRFLKVDGNGEIDFTEFCNSMARRIELLGEKRSHRDIILAYSYYISFL